MFDRLLNFHLIRCETLIVVHRIWVLEFIGASLLYEHISKCEIWYVYHAQCAMLSIVEGEQPNERWSPLSVHQHIESTECGAYVRKSGSRINEMNDSSSK